MISDTSLHHKVLSACHRARKDHLLEKFLWSHRTTPHHKQHLTTPHHTIEATPHLVGSKSQQYWTDLKICFDVLCLGWPYSAALVSNMINCPRKIFSLSVNNRNELLMYFYGLLWKLGDIKHTHIVILRLQCWGGGGGRGS